MSTSFSSLLKQGIISFKNGANESARTYLEQALLLRPTDGNVHYFLGTIAEKEGQLEQAASHYYKVLEQSVAMREAYIQLANVLCRQNKKEDAFAILTSAQRKFPNDHDILYLRGQIAMYALPGWHLPMLADHTRVNAYEKAIVAHIQPDDIVLDIGTGSGLLAMMAARAGAAHVYACENQPTMAALAREIIAQNGFSDRITIIPKYSDELEIGTDIPEKCDVLVTEIFDRAIVGEGALKSITHAQTHLLKENARVIPQGATLYGVLVQCPHLKNFHHIESVAGFDLSAMNVLAHPLAYKEAFIGPESSELHSILSEPFVIHDFDFSKPTHENFHSSSPVNVIKDGLADTVLMWFDLHLDQNTVLSTKNPRPDQHWRQAAQILLNPTDVTQGKPMSMQTLYKGYFDFRLKYANH